MRLRIPRHISGNTRLRPFFKYYGSKYNLAKRYPLPEYDHIIEPFAGSASYSTLYYDRQVTLIENDVEIASLWRWLIQANPAEILRLPYRLEPGYDIRKLDISFGAQCLIRGWQRVGRGYCWTVSKWNNSNTGFWSKEVRAHIARQVEYIRHWKVLFMPWEEFNYPRDCTLFVDPPYESQPVIYKNAPINYELLGRFCQSYPEQVIVCEAPGATWLPFRFLHTNVIGPGANKKRLTRFELFWTNGRKNDVTDPNAEF